MADLKNLLNRLEEDSAQRQILRYVKAGKKPADNYPLYDDDTEGRKQGEREKTKRFDIKHPIMSIKGVKWISRNGKVKVSELDNGQWELVRFGRTIKGEFVDILKNLIEIVSKES